MDYVALMVACITMLYCGLHGLMFERYVEKTLGGCPKLLYDRSRDAFYLKWTCLKCGRSYRTIVTGHRESLMSLLDDTKNYVRCERCI